MLNKPPGGKSNFSFRCNKSTITANNHRPKAPAKTIFVPASKTQVFNLPEDLPKEQLPKLIVLRLLVAQLVDLKYIKYIDNKASK